TRDLTVESGPASWLADGSVGFDGSLDYAITLTLSKELTANYVKRAPLAGMFMTPDQRLIFDFRVNGAARDPRVSLDASKTGSRNGIRNAQDVIGKLTSSPEAKNLLDRLKKQIPGAR